MNKSGTTDSTNEDLKHLKPNATVKTPGDSAPEPESEFGAAIAKMLANDEDPEPVETTLRLTPAEECPVFAIGAQIGRQVALHSAADSLGRRTDAEEERRRDRIMDRADNALDLLREAASFQQATSLAGALAHVVVATQAVADIVEIDDTTEGREARVAVARRSLYSVAHALEAATGYSARVFGADYFMTAYADHLRVAYSIPQACYVKPGPKPMIQGGESIRSGTVYELLVRLNRDADDWQRLDEAAADLETEADENKRAPGAAQKRGMADLASAHVTRITNDILIAASAAGATTVRELGLQARIIGAWNYNWWQSQEDLSHGELACRTLLDRLMALAGVTHVQRRELSHAEVRDWVEDPFRRAQDYRSAERVDASYNSDLPDFVQQKDA